MHNAAQVVSRFGPVLDRVAGLIDAAARKAVVHFLSEYQPEEFARREIYRHATRDRVWNLLLGNPVFADTGVTAVPSNKGGYLSAEGIGRIHILTRPPGVTLLPGTDPEQQALFDLPDAGDGFLPSPALWSVRALQTAIYWDPTTTGSLRRATLSVGYDLAKIDAVVLSEALLTPRSPGAPGPRLPSHTEIPLEGFDELLTAGRPGSPEQDG
ncbi:hypothetical protein ACX80W_00880 [Arthrobacter sp. TMN-37]